MELTINKIKNLERKIFSDMIFYGDDISCKDHTKDEKIWIFFAPHFYAETPAIIKENLITKLQGNGQLLSMGSGPAYLEQFLVQAYNIPIENITLSDIDDKYTPKDFNFKKFNMHRDWPKFDKRFDYIIYPESIFLDSNPADDNVHDYNKKIEMFTYLVEKSLEILNLQGEILMKGIIPAKNVVDNILEEIKITNSELEYEYIGGPLLKRYLCIKK
jgi:hypothetical protein